MKNIRERRSDAWKWFNRMLAKGYSKQEIRKIEQELIRQARSNNTLDKVYSNA